MHRVPEVEITRRFTDATMRRRAIWLGTEMVEKAHVMGGELMYADVISDRQMVWRFKFLNRDTAIAFNKEFDLK